MKLPQRALAAVALSLGVTAPLHAQRGVFQEGQPLPDLELPTIDGERTFNLSELRGKKLLLIQFASW